MTFYNKFEKLTEKVYGFYRGKVIDNKDKEDSGRIKIKIYPFFDKIKNEHIPYAEPCFPIYDKTDTGTGSYSVPQIGSYVWCFFEDGDVRKPKYFANAVGKGKLPKISDIPSVSIFDGDISFDGKRENGKILRDSFGNTILIDEGKIWLLREDGTGISIEKDKIRIYGKGNSNKLSIDIDGDIKLKSTGKISLVNSGDIELGDENNLKKIVIETFQTLFNSHTHNVTALGSPTSPPLSQMNSTHLSSRVKSVT